jgi:chorismate synthase
VPFAAISALADTDDIRCVDADTAAAMRRTIDQAKAAGDTVGGAFEVVAHGVPVGLGSHTQWDRRIDGRLAQALMSIPAIKAVGFGIETAIGSLPGSQVHDEIVRPTGPSSGTVPSLSRPTNRAGGIEGGVTNGEDLRVTAWMKPISTLMKPLASVDLKTMSASPATIERSDVCAVPAAAVVGEAVVAIALAEALLEQTGGDTMDAVVAAHDRYLVSLKARLTSEPR